MRPGFGRCALLGLGALFLLGTSWSAPAASILTSKHNLSAWGPGEIKAETELNVCVFCHTPHTGNAAAPRWNRFGSGVLYTPYSSSTLSAAVGQPTGTSKLCLSCHDGTVALGMVRSRLEEGLPEIRMRGGVTTMPLGHSRLGTDLGDDHPISFRYDSALAALDGQLRYPASLSGPVRLEDGQVQCTSCHNAHDDQYGHFLVQNNRASALCLTCHSPHSWNLSSHQSSPKTWNGAGLNPWPRSSENTVANNACQNCHRPHSAGTKSALLNHPGEEQNCFPCHNGNVATHNLQAEFNKIYTHPIQTAVGLHDPAEDPIHAPRHVECVDCHNPHAANGGAAAPPAVPGALAGVKGVNLSGLVVNPLNERHELCFRCHADSSTRGPARVPRQFPQTNTRLEFSPSSVSFHPVATTGRNPSGPSLLAPLTPGSRITCTSCHNNDQGPAAGGTGPSGPHGSSYPALLERRQELTDYNSAPPDVLYQLCLKCHDWNSLRNNESFSSHERHVRVLQTACTTCHDPHASPNTHLINFNTSYVTPNRRGLIQFVSTGRFQGRCSLTCHGKDHDNLEYRK